RGSPQAPAVTRQLGIRVQFGSGNAVAQLLNRADEIAYLHAARVILHGGPVSGEIHARPNHSRRVGQGAFHATGAGRAGHAGDWQVHPLRSGHGHAGTSKPSSRTASARASGRVRSASNVTAVLACSRSTAAWVTPGIERSLRSTLRAQFAHVMPRTGRVTVWFAIRLMIPSRSFVPVMPVHFGNR